ncbi:C-signal [Anolis carolinensis]|uniref:C-factor n=1 Tax=Anolis carolinensis TaxID=28377 RepID=R4GA97_ANOCA|nr:PREDICTED: C-factor [Anolis carolinensis]|eukprot:XP_003229926.1 PREDICTED: C-factor [Anolis carolinensis]
MPESVLVTGANRGIGLELVKQLLGKERPPKTLFATCRDPQGPGAQELRALASKHPNLVILKLEATNPASIQSAAKEAKSRLGDQGLNLLINNAGVMPACTLESATAKDMLDVYNINLVGPMLVTKAFLPLLKRAAQASPHKALSCGKAAIINMSTILSSIEKTPEMYHSFPVISYRCSKAALNMLTKLQSMGYKEEGILCTAIHPGWVKTDLGTEQADLTVEESVAGILEVLSSLSEKHHGILVTWEGKTLPW